MNFDRCIPPSSPDELNYEFYKRLYNAECFAGDGIVFRINSAFRSIDYEKSKGRSCESSHCKGLAVDIYCPNNSFRWTVLKALIGQGFTRFGIGKNFIHVDADPNKNSCIWLYE